MSSIVYINKILPYSLHPCFRVPSVSLFQLSVSTVFYCLVVKLASSVYFQLISYILIQTFIVILHIVNIFGNFYYSWLALTNPKDVARVESRTFICTKNKSETVPQTKDGIKGTLGNWISPEAMEVAIKERFPGCMKGKERYNIP